ncbi:helix-hairpin-helix domain-containing protein [Streptomyces sp. NPDC056600]|uniref:helix-hairpin-helix domain-containing protein n=1 Tax=Streptomyces sp. NPDC056600 TaxID=3345874 RepID=UPI003673C741
MPRTPSRAETGVGAGGGHGRGRHRRVPEAAEVTRHRAAALFAVTPGGAPVPPVPAPLPEPVPASSAQETGPEAGRAFADRLEAVRDRLPPWLRATCALHRRGVVALAALLALAVALALQHHLAARPRPVAPPSGVTGAEPSPFRPRPAAASGPATAPPIVVDVGGKVRDPGVHSLPAGSRVADALRAAGGVRPGADTGVLNRARFLVDGEQLLVGIDPQPGAAPPASGPAPAAGAPGPAAPVSLNTATVEQLDALPGVGPVLAQHIVDHRTSSGGFRSVEELREVNGIGDRRFADLRDLVRP